MKKKELASSISNSKIDEMYEKALQNGAVGGKLLGAGGGGFLLFYCPEEKQILLREKLRLKQFPLEFEYDGSSVVYIGDRYWEANR
jgi:D-glycero-alpha-D-manno-heptose-7-phosphate kinase